MMRFRSRHRVCALLPAFWLIPALLAPVPATGSRQKPQGAPGSAKESQSSPPFTFKVPVNVVLVNVTVTDKAGKPVKDLTADEFKLYEDGKRQEIQSFELESSQPVVKAEAVEPASGQPGVETPRMQSRQDSEDKRTRLISCFIDDVTARSPRHYAWVISALQKFVAEEMGPQDQVGIFSASGGVRIPFTGDQKLLQDQIENLHIGKLNLSRPFRSDCPVMTDVQVNRIVEGQRGMSFTRAVREATICIAVQDLDPGDIEQHVLAEAFHQHEGAQSAIHRLLAGLLHHLRYLQYFSASKSLVLFSDGFVPARSMRWRLDRVVDRALRSRVAFNVVDIRGLYNVGFDANSNAQARNVSPFGLTQEDFIAGLGVVREISGLFRDQVYQRRPLEKLTQDTGGVYFSDSNDLLAGLRQISNTQSFYYVLSYASPDQKASGKYHKIKVEVDRPSLELSYRRGYFAPREKLSLEDRKNEDIQLALGAPGDFDQIPLQLAYESDRLEEDRYRLSLLTNVKIGGVPFQQEGGRRQNLLHLVVMVYDDNDEHVEGSEQTIELNLSNASYRTMLRHGFTAKTDMEVPAGRYKVKAVVRESNQTKMGSLQQTVRLPIPESKARPPSPETEAGVGEAVRLSVPENRAKASLVEVEFEDESLIPSFPLAGLESSNLVLSQQLTPLADLSGDLQQSLLESSDSMIFGDVQIHPPIDDQIDRQQPVTFFYTLYNLKYPEESEGMTAKVQFTDRRGRVSRFPLIELGEGRTRPRGQGRVTVAFNLSFKNVQPGRYKLTVMTKAPAANGQSVGSQTTITVMQ